MPNATVELIKITGVSPYSVYAGQTRYSFNKGVSSDQFQKGHTYSVAVKVGKNGGKYIDRVDSDLGMLNADVSSVPQPNNNKGPLNPETNKLPTDDRPRRSKQGEPLTDYDLSVQDQISRSGVIQAAVQAVAAHVSSVDELKVKAKELAEDMLVWVRTSRNSQSEVSEPQSKA